MMAQAQLAQPHEPYLLTSRSGGESAESKHGGSQGDDDDCNVLPALQQAWRAAQASACAVRTARTISAR